MVVLDLFETTHILVEKSVFLLLLLHRIYAANSSTCLDGNTNLHRCAIRLAYLIPIHVMREASKEGILAHLVLVGDFGEFWGEKIGLLSPNPKPVVFRPNPRKGAEGESLPSSELPPVTSTIPAPAQAAAGGGTNGASGEVWGDCTTLATGTAMRWASWAAIRSFALSFAPRGGDS
jgi:hypothetical protein